MKKASQLAVLIIAVVIMADPIYAQKLIKKELITENNDKDGFQYQWNKYTYILGKDTLEAAFNVNGKRITPNGYKDGKGCGVFYYGGGMFGVWSKNKGVFGHRLMSGYNVKGECVFPETIYNGMFYIGDGLFTLDTRNELGKRVCGLFDYKANCIIPESKGFSFFLKQGDFIICDIFQENYIYAVYDLKGNCIISEELGYSWIAYYPEYEFFWCDKSNGREYSISKDGRYYAEGRYNDSERSEFDRKKSLVPNRKNNYSSHASTASYSTKSSTASGSTENGLLYEGDYTEGSWVNSNTGWSQPPVDPHHHIKIYEDHLEDGFMVVPYNGISINGERTYHCGWPERNYLVDNYYNIRIDAPGVYCRLSKGNVVFDMNVPAQNDHNGMSGRNDKGSTSGKQQNNQPKKIICDKCGGTGKCIHCNGTHRMEYKFGTGTIECTYCKPDGKCTKCGGSGYITY